MSEQAAEIDHLRAVAQAAMTGRVWEWSARGEHGYPQQVISQGDAVLVAECYESPDYPSAFAEFIATFDPPTVLALLDAISPPDELQRATAEAFAAMTPAQRRAALVTPRKTAMNYPPGVSSP